MLRDFTGEKMTFLNKGFLITNKSGGYCSLGIDSRYSGVFFRVKDRMFKIIDDIKVPGITTEIHDYSWRVKRRKNSLSESFWMPMHTNTLVYELSSHEHIDLLLDIREAYDTRNWGKKYDIFVENGKIIVKFTKFQDYRDGDSGQEKEYELYLVIEGDDDLHYKETQNWIKKEYSSDRERGSLPYEMYIFDSMKLLSKKLVFSVSEDKGEAVKAAEKVIKNMGEIKEMQKKYHKLHSKGSAALRHAINSLDSLLVRHKAGIGLYAGLPWFFQFWTRDEAISLKALMLENEFSAARDILMRQLNSVDHGKMPNRVPATETGTADALGWHFERWHDLIDLLSRKGLLQKYFTKEEMVEVTSKLKAVLGQDFKNSTEDLLAVSSEKETWMDTIPREGKRIEIQALRLVMFKLVARLTGDGFYQEIEERMKRKVRETFWDGSLLHDSPDDAAVRPNVFIAAYLYPGLLSQDEWEACFDNLIPRLWLDWGGFSTIDKDDPKFCGEHSGEEPVSYHNGDSWFWINNMAALVLHRTNSRKYKTYIEQIKRASTEEILSKGLIGHHAELSSAKELRGQGCLCQAWSSAIYIELMQELSS